MSVFNSIFNSGARPAGQPSIAGLISSVLDRPGGSPNSYSNGGNAAAPKAAVVGPSRPPWTGDESDGYPSTQDRAGNPFWWRGNPYVRAYYDAYKADPVTCHCGSCGMKVIEGQAPIHARPVEVMVLEIQDEVLAAAGTPPPSDLSALPPTERQAAERMQQALDEAKVKAEAEIWARQVEDQMDSFRRNGDIAAVKAITKWQLDVNLRQRAMIHERGLAWYEKYPHSAAAIIAKYFVEPPQPLEAVTVPAATVLQSAAPPPDDASVAAPTAPTHEPAATTGNVTTIAATTTAKKALSRDHREAASAFVIKGTMERAMMAKPNYTHAAAAASGSSGSGGGQPAHKKSTKAKTRKEARNARKLEAKSKAAAGVDSPSQDRCEIF